MTREGVKKVVMGIGLLIMLRGVTAKEIQNCDQCIQTTKTGTMITRTLMYYNVAPECVKKLDPCVHNQTQYFRCKTRENKTECYEPLAVGPITSSIYVYGYKGGNATLYVYGLRNVLPLAPNIFILV